MTPRKRAPWSKSIEERGVTVRLYERGGRLYVDVWYQTDETDAHGRPIVDKTGKTATVTSRDRRSLGHGDRRLAEEQARTLAQRVAELRFAGQTSALTMGQLVSLYERDRLPDLSANRQRAIRGMTSLLLRHFGRDFAVDDLSQPRVDSYVAARKSGEIRSPRHRGAERGVRAGTIRNELHLLVAMLTWATQARVGGRRLLAVHPLPSLAVPQEKNAKRPVASQERYEKTLAVADRVTTDGRLRTMLVLARTTGRRVNSIAQLRASDVLRTAEQLERALAAAGLDVRQASAWTSGAIRWSEASDKMGFEAVAPISREAREALDRYLADRPRVGDVPLFPSSTDATKPVPKVMAGWWLRKAERLAKLPHMARGGWHSFRRMWASERRHLPAQDVAAAGGWRSLNVMRSAYQHAEADVVLRVVENAPESPATGTNKAQARSKRGRHK